ncbi:hypothetical protein G3I76_58855, partial [Streptomyces sp. SID11233]|nr:hypothetical protein [Streptomyces sp. SID11233]
NVLISDDADIRGSVYGGGNAGSLGIQPNRTTGDANTVVTDGHIGTNIYAGGRGTSYVQGTSTVRLKDIGPDTF